MTTAMGPTVPRWSLGKKLRDARDAAGLTPVHVCDELAMSKWKLIKIEHGQGKRGPSRSDLRALCELYGLDEVEYDRLDGLRKLGTQRGWWARYVAGRSEADILGTFLDIESAATSIRSWQPYGVHGLLQTEAYLQAMVAGWGLSDDLADEQMRIRLERQERVWAREPDVWIILDESVLYRTFGDPAMHKDQLARLLEPPTGCTIQVLPFTANSHQGRTGSLTIFEFDPELHTPIAHSDSVLGGVYIEDENVARAQHTINELMSLAPGPSDAQVMIRASMDRVSNTLG